MLLNIIARLSTCNFIATHNTSGMQLVFDEIVGSFQKFGSHYDYGGGAVADLFVLQLRKLHDYLGGWVLHVQLAEDSCS